MGYYRYTLKCLKCGEVWASFFCSVDMTSGAHDCPKCGSGEHEKVADAWEFEKVDENGKKTGETFWH